MTNNERLQYERLKQIASRLRQELHGFRELFDEHDHSSGQAIQDFDEFLCGVHQSVSDDDAANECLRCGGCGVVPTEGHESHCGAQDKPCPDCSR